MFSKDIGIDLGTANTLVFIKNKGIVINEPSVVAINTHTSKVLAVGDEAKQMIGRTPENIVAIRPLKDGVIADFETTQAMLKYFIQKAASSFAFSSKPRVVICVPSGVTEVEKRAVFDATVSAGARMKDVYLIEEPMAAAIGSGLPVQDATGSMIVDIGGGTSEVAVISLNGIVTAKSLRVAGDELDEHIISYVKKEFNLSIGERTAEALKLSIGSAFTPNPEKKLDIRGRDLITGLPKVVSITAVDMFEAINEQVNAIVDAIKYTLEKTPPELASDVMEFGIMLSGGGAMLQGLDKLIESETGIMVRIAPEPLNSVVLGTGRVLDSISSYKNSLISHKTLNM